MHQIERSKLQSLVSCTIIVSVLTIGTLFFQEYQFIAEFATPIMSIWEMGDGGIAGLTPEDKVHQRMLFGNKLQQILEHPNNKHCHDKSTYLEYDGKSCLLSIDITRLQHEF